MARLPQPRLRSTDGVSRVTSPRGGRNTPSSVVIWASARRLRRIFAAKASSVMELREDIRRDAEFGASHLLPPPPTTYFTMVKKPTIRRVSPRLPRPKLKGPLRLRPPSPRCPSPTLSEVSDLTELPEDFEIPDNFRSLAPARARGARIALGDAERKFLDAVLGKAGAKRLKWALVMSELPVRCSLLLLDLRLISSLAPPGRQKILAETC